MSTVYPLILCGGSGTRLWPLSRKSYPKQFVPFLGDESLFQSCIRRVSGAGEGVSFAAPIVVTGSDFRFLAAEQLQEVGVEPGAILLEPEGRNTAPAILAAALHVMQGDPDAMLLVCPSDHVLPDEAGFRRAVAQGAGAVTSRGDLVTFGILPDRPETGYGYLHLSQAPDGSGQPLALRSFVEKPDAQAAETMLAQGDYLWNAGIFLFAARDIIAAFEVHAPELLAPVRRAVSEARVDLDFLRLDPGAWSEVEPISIDYAIMERADNLSVVPYGGGWSDLGSWSAVQEQSTIGAQGLAISGPVTALDCHDSLLFAHSPDQELVGLGLEGIVAVAMPDAVLVADKSRSQDVKLAVQALKERGVKQAEMLPVDYRPWGHFETLALGERFQVKRIVVKPGAALSLQSHVHRAEHWVVVEGTAKVTIADQISLVAENQSVYIPLGAKHRLENPGKLDMILIEIQTGSYLGEDDITRYEDVYARD